MPAPRLKPADHLRYAERDLSFRISMDDALEQYRWQFPLGWAPYGPQPKSIQNAAHGMMRSKPLVWC